MARTLFEMAQVYRILGESTKSQLFHQKAYAIRESTLGPDHPDLLKSRLALTLFE